MFNLKDFYPTPRHVVDKMVFGKDLKGKVVLEPEAGKGDIYGREERRALYLEFNTWYDWEFFRFKGFKKGSLHMEFKDDHLWDTFNLVACKAKGFKLAEKYTSDFRAKKTYVKVYTKK